MLPDTVTTVSDTRTPRVLVEQGGAGLRIGLDRGAECDTAGLRAFRDRRDPVRTGR